MRAPATTVDAIETGNWDHVGTNLTGTMFCLGAELQHLNDYGSIVNIASLAGLIGFPNIAPYVASKHGAIGLTRSAAKEVRKGRNVRINAVAPGAVKTAL
jgi:NAD(P)-dependent dehydrogenase (short-subunit alcohol dehydrogenase family)